MSFYVYRWDLTEELPAPAIPEGTFFLVAGPADVWHILPTWIRNWGWKEAIKAALKVASGKRQAFGVVRKRLLIQSGWTNLGFCRFYPVEADAVVVGTLWTDPDFRGRGIASAAIRLAMNALYRHGYRRYYIDAGDLNKASQRMIEKAGFRNRSEGNTSNPHDALSFRLIETPS